MVTLVVNAAGTGGPPGRSVNLASVYNRSAMVTDGSTSASGLLDGQGYAYSANLLGSTVSFHGSSFTLGPANAPDAVSSATIPLPTGQYTTLGMLATAVNGNQPSQTFVVNYSDGTSSTLVESLSDWFTPQSYAGESVAVTMAYRDTAGGGKDDRTFNLYGYSFTLNSIKTATSITLPNNADVVVLALTLVPTTAPAADFSLAASPGSQTVTTGGTGSYTATVGALNGFAGAVTLSASGVPAGTTASFNPNAVNGAGTSTLSLITTGSTAAGTYTVTITGVSGALQHTSTVKLVVNAASANAEPVNLSSVFNRSAMVTDGSTSTSGLLDGQGYAYSANLLGSTVSLHGTSFILGLPNVPDSVSSSTIELPAGQYTTLGMLATGVDGNQASQTFAVNYSDGASSTFVQSLSDWFTPQSYAGESVAVTMAYRDTAGGGKDDRTFNLYGYSFTLNSAKTATSITLPNNGDVVVLALTLVPTGAPAANFSVTASPGSQTVTAGGTGSYTATVGALNGFASAVTLSASGLPAGTTASFSPNAVNGAGTSSLSLITTGSTVAGAYTVTITGVSGTLQHSTTVTLVVNAASTGLPVNLASVYNRTAMVTDGSTFTSEGLDGQGNAYSANLLGSTLSLHGLSFLLGPANAPDAVSSTTIELPAGPYTTLAMLATGVDGNQPSQTFAVHYNDGTSSTFVQSLSDWFTPQTYPNESIAAIMPYRDTIDGRDNRTFYLYGYSFTLNNTKTATSITLPNNDDVAVFAITLAP